APARSHARRRRWASPRPVSPAGYRILGPRWSRSSLSDLGEVVVGSLVVDLSALEAPGEVDVDRLPLRVRVEGDVPGLAVAVAGLLPAAEREVDLGAGHARVDVDDACLEV